MPSNLACLGLDVADGSQLQELLDEVLSDATALGRGPGGIEVVRWQDPSGARVVAALTEGHVVDLLPSFAGEPGATLDGVQMVNDEVAAAAVVDADGEQVTALALELEQRRLLTPGTVVGGRACVVALGTQVEVHADVAAFTAAGAGAMAAESFLSYGVFGPPAESTADARLAGTVLWAERRTVGLTGQSFVVARVRTAGFEADVCLAGSDRPEPPAPGQVVAGLVFMVGNIEIVDTACIPAYGPAAARRRRRPWGRRS